MWEINKFSCWKNCLNFIHQLKLWDRQNWHLWEKRQLACQAADLKDPKKKAVKRNKPRWNIGNHLILTSKYWLQANNTIRCTLINCPSAAKVTSTSLSFIRRLSKTDIKVLWWLFHFKQNSLRLVPILFFLLWNLVQLIPARKYNYKE